VEAKANGAVNGAASVAPDLSYEGASKVNAICDRFLAVLTAIPAPSSPVLRNIITAHVCKQPPDIDAGLLVVASINSSSPDADNERAERAAEHITFLADVNAVYSAALGLYDIHLTLLIAQQSQKDPREYLPYLQSLLEMPHLRRKFTIDTDLGRHAKALTHLHAMGQSSFDELQRYTQKHELYQQAIELFRYQSEQSNTLTRLYADFLSQRNRFADAALAYDFLGMYPEASEAYRQASMWKECLSTALLVPDSSSKPEQVRSLALSLASTCEETKDFASAAMIHRDYLDDAENAIRLFCRAYDVAEAIRLVSIHRRPEYLETIVDPGIIEAAASVTETLSEMREQLRNQLPRLRELREKAAADPLAFHDGGVGGAGDGVDIPDNISLAPTDASTSGGTFMTRYTGRGSEGTAVTGMSRKTHKNRRREERKRARGKKGTVYEEEYLVNSIKRLIERVNEMNGDVRKLVEGAVRRGMKERARNLEGLMGEVVEACRAVVVEVFRAEHKAEGGIEGGELKEKPMGGDGVLWDSLESVSRKVEAPVVTEFKKLSLLDS
jgi:elongator complex protein 1